MGTDWEKAEAALQGYGDAIAFEVLEDCIVARTFVSVIWYVILQQQRPDAGRLAQLEHYLNWLRQREGRT
jgi:hypothetical protein